MVQAKFLNGVRMIVGVLGCAMFPLSNADQLMDDETLQQQFSIGVDAIEHDRLKTAREAFNGILSSNPGLHRARLELARAYYLSLDYENARREAQQVLDDPNTPVSVRTTLLAFLAQIESDEKRRADRHHWTPSIYLGFMHDSNVNVGPNRDVVNIGGTQFDIADDSKEKRDTAFVVTPALTHTYNPGKTFEVGEHTGYFLWQSQLNGYYRSYFDEADFNLGVLTLRTGPAWVMPRHWRAGIGFQADQIWLDDGDLALFTTVNPNITWQVGDNTEVTLDSVLTNRKYSNNEDTGREGWYKAGNLSLGQYFNNKKIAVQGGAGYSKFDADDKHFSHMGPDAFLGIIVQAWKSGSAYARAGYRKYDFDGEEPVFGKSRDDDEYRYTVGFQHSVRTGPLNKWQVQGGWVYTNNNSNISIFEYDRNQFNLGISRSF